MKIEKLKWRNVWLQTIVYSALCCRLKKRPGDREMQGMFPRKQAKDKDFVMVAMSIFSAVQQMSS